MHIKAVAYSLFVFLLGATIFSTTKSVQDLRSASGMFSNLGQSAWNSLNENPVHTSPALAPTDALPGAPNVQILNLAPTGEDRANAVTFSPDGKILAVGSSLGIYLFDANSYTQITFFNTDTWVRSLTFSPDGSILVSGSYDPTIRLWRVKDGTLLGTLEGHSGWVRSVALSPDGKILASSADDNTVKLWDISAGSLLRTLQNGTVGVQAVAFSPDGSTLATGGYDQIIRLWQVSDGALVKELKGHTGWIRTLKFSPDGETLASGGFDATARLWRVSDGSLLQTLTGHTESVLSVDFSPDGKTLATGSADATIRLWRVSDGKLLNILQGHNDFIFSVEFSPQGNQLASGAVDNTVRLWSINDQILQAGLDGPLQIPPAKFSSNCVACHHPGGNFIEPKGANQAPRAIEVSCETCHSPENTVLNFCPNFHRQGEKVDVSEVTPVGPDKVGLPVGTQNLQLVISTPGNGERFYSRGDTLVAAPVKGRVFSTLPDKKEIEVHFEIWQGGNRVASEVTNPDENGYFTFPINLAPQGSVIDEVIPVPNLYNWCVFCHEDIYQGAISFPEGEDHLIVTAIAPDGEKASDNRWISMDYSHTTTVKVKVVEATTGQAVAGLPVHANGLLYNWRGRVFSASTGSDGMASIQVEVSSQLPVSYELQVNPVVIGGLQYEGTEPVEVVVPPDGSDIPPVTLEVMTMFGSIQGQVTGKRINNEQAIQVWAIHLPDGLAQIVPVSSDGTFRLNNLPVSQYLLTTDQQALASQNLSLIPRQVDLTKDVQVNQDLQLVDVQGRQIQGRISDENGVELPFAWTTLENSKQTQAVLPGSGSFVFPGSAESQDTAIISAPGYYSQAQIFENGKDQSLDVSLVARGDNRRIVWGTGNVFLPQESNASVEGNHIDFAGGWIWGSGQAENPLLIQVGLIEISIPGGKFALEKPPGGETWFFLFDGQASLSEAGSSNPVTLEKDQMAILSRKSQPVAVPYDPVVVAALNPQTSSPIPATWQPTLSAQIQNRIALIGISTAQLVTFITYLTIFLSVVIVPLVAIYWFKKKNAKKG